MRAKEFVFLGVRIYAVFMVIEFIAVIPQVLSLFIANPKDFSALVGLIPVLFFIGIATVLFVRTNWFVEKIFARVADSPYYEFDDATESDELESNEEDAQEEPEVIGDNEEDAVPHQPILLEDIQAIAFSVIGVWILSAAIPDFIGYLAYCLRNPDYGFFRTLFSIDNLKLKITILASLIIGIYLFRYSLDLRKFWHGLRRAGVRDHPDGEPS